MIRGQRGEVIGAGWRVLGEVIAVGLHSFAVAFKEPEGVVPNPWFNSEIRREDGAYKRHGEDPSIALYFLPR